jgi:hypothetical protein
VRPEVSGNQMRIKAYRTCLSMSIGRHRHLWNPPAKQPEGLIIKAAGTGFIGTIEIAVVSRIRSLVSDFRLR